MSAAPTIEMCPQSFIDFAARLADAGGAHARRYFQTPIEVVHKDDKSPVTVADREGEALMRGMIRMAYPDHGILGEELPPEGADADYVWLLDPIDGTIAFVTGLPMFGMLITLLHRRRPILGLIDHPALGQRWIGARGRATTSGGRAVRVRPCAALADATLHCASPNYFKGHDRARFLELSDTVRLVSYGGFAYAYGLLASGFVDLVVDGGMHRHDYLPLVPIVEGAGGVVADWSGAPVGWNSREEVIVAGNREVMDQALDLLAPERAR